MIPPAKMVIFPRRVANGMFHRLQAPSVSLKAVQLYGLKDLFTQSIRTSFLGLPKWKNKATEGAK